METLQNHKPLKYKCPDCKNRYTSLAFLLKHVATEHKDNIPEGVTPKQYCFNARNHKDFQLCTICKKNRCAWNEEAGHYNRFCSPECKKKAGEIAERNLVKKIGMTRSERLKKVETQKQMLAGRSISGTYTFSDKKTTLNFVGSFEEDFLRTYDLELNENPLNLLECPFTFEYVYEGERHWYLPDYILIGDKFITIIEIKDGGDDPNTHPKIQAVDKVKEKLKDQAIINSKKYNYIKIVNKDYTDFVNLLNLIKERNSSEDNNFQPIIIIPAA